MSLLELLRPVQTLEYLYGISMHLFYSYTFHLCQDIQSNVERSMQSLLAAGSAIGQRMLGMITRAPRLLSSAQIRHPQPAAGHPQHPPQPVPLVFHQAQHNHGEGFPNFDDCDCQFGK